MGMIPPNRIDQQMRELSTKPNPLGKAPMSAGPLTGTFASPPAIVVAGLLVLLVSVSLFAGAYIRDRAATMLTFPKDSDNLALAFWIFGWFALVCSLLLFLAAAVVRDMKRMALEEEMFKTEPRDFDFPATINQHVVEVVKVRCRYCGTLNEASSKNCIACGATM